MIVVYANHVENVAGDMFSITLAYFEEKLQGEISMCLIMRTQKYIWECERQILS